MTDDADSRLHCHACGHLISGRVRTYRCPVCGSYDVALTPLPPAEWPKDTVPRPVPATPIARVPWTQYLSVRPPKGVPRALWMHLRPLRLLVIPVLMMMLSAPIAIFASVMVGRSQVGRIPPPPPPAWLAFSSNWSPAVLLLSSSALGIIPYLAKRRLRRFEREIITDDLQRCLACGYPLKGLPERHRCPECGEPYDMVFVRKTWASYLEAQK
jgi:predicted RNA-binding Zn-ribbon protein involved in translation (DUF1610 family)